MIAQNPVQSLNEYGRDTPQGYIIPPSAEQTAEGVKPLDSLPAQWWNALWNQMTVQERNTVTALNSIVTEINTLLQAYGVTPSDAATNQVALAIANAIAITATSTKAGTVKSSNASGQVSVDTDGIMTANGMGQTEDLQTVLKDTIVNAINEVLQKLNAHEARTDNPHQVTKAQVGLPDVVNKPTDNAPTANSDNYVTSGGVKTAIDQVQANLTTHIENTSNPHQVTKAQVGLPDVVNKPTDNAPTANSDNYVTSGGVKTAIDTAVSTAENLTNATGTLAIAHGGTGQTSVDDTPVSGSAKMVKSGGVYSALRDWGSYITAGNGLTKSASNLYIDISADIGNGLKFVGTTDGSKKLSCSILQEITSAYMGFFDAAPAAADKSGILFKFGNLKFGINSSGTVIIKNGTSGPTSWQFGDCTVTSQNGEMTFNWS